MVSSELRNFVGNFRAIFYRFFIVWVNLCNSTKRVIHVGFFTIFVPIESQDQQLPIGVKVMKIRFVLRHQDYRRLILILRFLFQPNQNFARNYRFQNCTNVGYTNCFLFFHRSTAGLPTLDQHKKNMDSE